MGLFNKLDANRVFDVLSGGLDKLMFTEQERSEVNIKLADKLADFTKDTLSENTVRSATRRYMSIVIVSCYMLIVVAYAVFSMLNIECNVLRDIIYDSNMSIAFLMVLAFFYGGYYSKNFFNKK